MKLIGLDIETTGLEVARHGIVSIGAYDAENSFYVEMSPGNVLIDDEALSVNGFTREKIVDLEPIDDLDLADLLIRKFSYRKSVGEPYLDNDEIDIEGHIGEFYPVGFNVGHFDMAFIRRYYPITGTLFSHRAVDLNSIAMFIADQAFDYDYEFVKKTIKERAALDLGLHEEYYSLLNNDAIEQQDHHALYDAAISWLSYKRAGKLLREIISDSIVEYLLDGEQF